MECRTVDALAMLQTLPLPSKIYLGPLSQGMDHNIDSLT